MDVHELFSLNRWECKNDIEHLLASGTTLIVDRYAYSGVVYTAAKGTLQALACTTHLQHIACSARAPCLAAV